MSPPEAAARIVVLRHGETEWSAAGRHTSHTDVALTDIGERQAREAGRTLGALGLRNPDVLCSPLARSRRTAELAGLSARAWDSLTEWDYGDYEGLTSRAIRQRVPHWTVWTHPCPGGEEADSVAARADMVLAVAAARLADRDVVLVGHGHFSRALITRWMGLPLIEGRRFAMSTASAAVLGFDHGFRQLLALNIHPRSDP